MERPPAHLSWLSGRRRTFWQAPNEILQIRPDVKRTSRQLRINSSLYISFATFNLLQQPISTIFNFHSRPSFSRCNNTSALIDREIIGLHSPTATTPVRLLTEKFSAFILPLQQHQCAYWQRTLALNNNLEPARVSAFIGKLFRELQLPVAELVSHSFGIRWWFVQRTTTSLVQSVRGEFNSWTKNNRLQRP